MRFTEESIQRAAVRAEKTLWNTPAGFNKDGVRLDWIATVHAAIAQLVPVEEPQPEVNGDLLRAACDAYEGSGRIAAVIRVVLDEALKPLTDEAKTFTITVGYANLILEQRKSRLLRPASVEERVTIILTKDDRREVLLDRKYTGIWFRSQEPAEIYRLGLIAKLKEEEDRDA